LQILRKDVQNALRRRDPGPIRELVVKCISAGADAIDINSGPLNRNPESDMQFLVDAVQSVTDCQILLDTTNAKAMRAGLNACKNRPVINGVSLERAKLDQMLPLAAEFDADLIGYLLDAGSQVPTTEAESIDIAISLFNAVEAAGVAGNRLIIDPIVVPLMWQTGTQHNMAILSVIQNLPDVLGFSVRTIAGVSNLTTGNFPQRKKLMIEAAYLPMLAAAGLDMALLNIFHKETVQLAKACSVILQPTPFSWAALE
jgi:5-methyltetrahydrofolate corrinoid/iron sulfur protein methyltransferase